MCWRIASVITSTGWRYPIPPYSLGNVTEQPPQKLDTKPWTANKLTNQVHGGNGTCPGYVTQVQLLSRIQRKSGQFPDESAKIKFVHAHSVDDQMSINMRYERNRVRGTGIIISTVVTYVSCQQWLHVVAYLCQQVEGSASAHVQTTLTDPTVTVSVR